MNLLAITATCNRHTCIERSVGMFLAQENSGNHYIQLIFNNSDTPLSLDRIPEQLDKTIILINSCNKGYKTLGAIYNSALAYIPNDIDVVTHFDDDDLFLPWHFEKGLEGYKRALKLNKLAYKPEKSYYRHSSGIEETVNNMEPSIFINADFLKEVGYQDTTSDQHMKWFNKLIRNKLLYTDKGGTPTMLYNWGDNFQTFKTSGDPYNPNNFENYRKNSIDIGDSIITPTNPIPIYKQLYNDINRLYAKTPYS